MNHHFAAYGQINRVNVASLQTKYTINTTDFNCLPFLPFALGMVFAPITIHNGIGYFTSFGGFLGAFDVASGTVLWANCLLSVTSGQLLLSRNSPTINVQKGLLYIGDFLSGRLWAFNITNGLPVWSTMLNNHPQACLTMSATISEPDDLLWVGVSSHEETQSYCANTTIAECSFKGNIVGLVASTGALLFSFQTIPGINGLVDGYAGNAVWGGAISYSSLLNLIFVATGNAYQLPPNISACVEAGFTNCSLSGIYTDSILALNAHTGALVWFKNFAGPDMVDVWVESCIIPGQTTLCPTLSSNDSDFSVAPSKVFTFITECVGRICLPVLREIICAAQKNGFISCMRADNGSLVSAAFSGIGGPEGGTEYSAAVDPIRNLYIFGNTNGFGKNVTLINGQNITSGFVTGYNYATKNIVWQTALPGIPFGYSMVSGGVYYQGTLTSPGINWYALSTSTGKILATFNATSDQGSQFNGGTVWKNCITRGFGYSVLAGGTNGLGIITQCVPDYHDSIFDDFEDPLFNGNPEWF